MSMPICVDIGDTWAEVGIEGLSYAPNEYDSFRAVIKNVDTGEEWEKIWTDSSTSGDTVSKKIYGLDRASEYEARTYATYDGEEYQSGNPSYLNNMWTYAENVDWAQKNDHPNGIYVAFELNSCDEYQITLDYGSDTIVKWAYPSDFDGDMGMVLFDEEIGDQSVDIYMIGFENDRPSKEYWGYWGFVPGASYSKPGISVSDTGLVTISKTGYYTVIEYEKVNTASSYSFTKEERDFFMDTHFAFIEAGLRHEGDDGILNRWTKSSVKVEVYYYSSVSGVEPITNSWVDDWCDEASAATGIPFSRVSSGGDILLKIGDHSDFGFSTGEYFQNGEWDTDVDIYGNIFSATAKVVADPIEETYKSMLWEELTQCLGCGYDQYYNIDSIHVELAGNNIESIQGIDSRILSLLYKAGLTTGLSRSAVARTINANNKVYTSSSSYQLENLEVGSQYRARAYGVDSSDDYSYKTSWVYFTPTSQRPDNWDWDSKISASGTAFDVLASDWNDFIARINEFRDYLDMSPGTFGSAASYNTVALADQFKKAAVAINEMNPPAGVATECLNVAPGGSIYRWHFINLAAALNSIV